MNDLSFLCAGVMRRMLTMVLVATALSLASSAGAQTPQRGGSLVFVMSSDPAMVNPVLTSDSSAGQIGCVVYQGLTTVIRDGVLMPLLAKSWTISPDGLTYTFVLNHANWQDGKPFTSDDVKFSLLEASSKYSAIFSSAAESIASIDTPAPDSVVIHLKQPFGPLLISLSCSHGGAILPKHIFEGTDIPSNKASTTAPIGTGPFKLESWMRGDRIRLVRNPDYWEPGKPYLDEVVGKIIPQATARTQALLAGSVDFVPYFCLPVTDYPVIRSEAAAFKLTPSPVAPAQDFLFLNTKHGPLGDKRVRQALFMALDRGFILKAAYRGLGSEGSSPFGNAGWFASKTIDYGKMYPFDVQRANTLLDDAGFKRDPGGTRFSIKFTYNTDDAESGSLAIAVQKMWQAVGVKVAIDPAERTTATKRVFQDGDFDAFVIAYTSYYDPALGLSRAWSSALMGKPFGNPTGFSDPAIDDQFEKSAHMTTQAERAAAYEAIQRVLADEVPIISLRNKKAFDASIVKLHGLEHENHLTTWREAWIEK